MDTVHVTFASYNAMLAGSPWFAVVLILLLGAIFAALLASCCVFVEVISYTVETGDRRLRFRMGCCCWLTPTDTADAALSAPLPPMGGGLQLASPPSPPKRKGWFGWLTGPSEDEKALI